MASQILRGGLLTSALLLLTACTVDVGRSASSASATDGRSPPWAITLQRQSSIAGSELHEINESDLRSGDLLFSSSLGVTSLGIRAFSASSVSHVALYLGDGQIAEATGAGVQIISVQQALAHSDKLFALRVPDLTPDQVMAMKNFAWQVKDSGYNYRGIMQFIPYMVTKPLCSLNPFSRDFRQQCVSGLAKAQLGDAASDDKKAWFCSEFVSEAFVRAGHPLTLAQAAWISPSDLLHMREGDVATFKPETQLQYVGHLKLGVYLQAGRLVGLNRATAGMN
ncbi:YaeF family permuted papain-like enzyme [Klebsiella quasivariicola]|uniref:YaeF family permuted papain-like enzyme n=1 Tax=Klebsiella quasivariicola TaxID=2026240 RepID=UPI00247AF01C|nr:YaeF family permuted papain-like enzyme [Klebsiella quasivariicola]